jgi:beta-lactamase class D
MRDPETRRGRRCGPGWRLGGVTGLCLALLLAGCGVPAPALPPLSATPIQELRPELESYFQGLPGAFVLYDSQANRYLRYNPQRGAERFLPASTFKILNALIGLETGVIPDENYVIPWDGKPCDVSSWNQDHTLRTAVQNSVVWYFQELARRVGRDRMQHYVTAASYGNADISGNIDSFWLDGGLRISADEQVEFLKRLYAGDLPFASRNVRLVKEILVLEKTDTYQFSGKTGTTLRIPSSHINWFVGYVEEKGNGYFFALNVDLPLSDTNTNRAKEIAKDILRGLSLIP